MLQPLGVSQYQRLGFSQLDQRVFVDQRCDQVGSLVVVVHDEFLVLVELDLVGLVVQIEFSQIGFLDSNHVQSLNEDQNLEHV
jgi:hypothetical protein